MFELQPSAAILSKETRNVAAIDGAYVACRVWPRICCSHVPLLAMTGLVYHDQDSPEVRRTAKT